MPSCHKGTMRIWSEGNSGVAVLGEQNTHLLSYIPGMRIRGNDKVRTRLYQIKVG